MQSLNIVKVGGKVVEDESRLATLIKRFVGMEGIKILVHGGGKTASEMGEKLGIQAKMIDGRRITDEATLAVVTMVYGGLINKKLVALLQAQACNALGLCGADLNVIRAIKRPVKKIDYGFAGDIVEVNRPQIQRLLDQGITPIFAPLTHNQAGQLLNTNADTIAAELALSLAKLYEVRLIYCFDKVGVLRDIQDDNSLIKQLNPREYQDYTSQGIIHQGMIPKLDNAFAALSRGVKQVTLCREEALSHGEIHGTTLML